MTHHGHTRRKRLALVLLLVLPAAAVLMVGVGAGAVPVSLAISARSPALSGQTFQVAADRLQGTGFTQSTGDDSTARGGFPEAVSGIRSADLYDLCQSVVSKVPGFGAVTVRITAGGGGHPAHADNLVVRSDDLSGDATFRDVTMGVDAGTFGGAAGSVGQQADAVTIDHLRQTTRAVSAATFRLNGLHLSVRAHAAPCF
ncbi:cholesterol esterase [Streptomyces sp. ICBB 8177]|nr:cholesterol esterase [Streptomyces sp. ICBB 8177]